MSIVDQIQELATQYFRMTEASDSEAQYVVDHIYGALSQVEEEQRESR